MDLRDLVRSHPDTVVGHTEITDSLNVRRESRRFESDPLESPIRALGDNISIAVVHKDVDKYFQAYSWYTLCLRRCFEQISVRRRKNSKLRYHPRNEKYSKRRKQIVDKRNTLRPYLELDYQNLIIHSCILLDRTIAISRRFLSGRKLPSFTSFNKHIDFLRKNSDALGEAHKEYQEKLVSASEWYWIPIRVLRDKYLMHSSERHYSFFGWSENKWDLEMITLIPGISNQATQSENRVLPKNLKMIRFSARQLAREIEEFLTWFAAYWEKQ
jgi:hypothetical protein